MTGVEIGKLMSQCAESKVYECSFFGAPAVLKHRFEKTYRVPQLDRKIREQRTVREARALVRARRAGAPAPAVFGVSRAECSIILQRINGVTARAFIDSCEQGSSLPLQVLRRMGEIVGLLHDADIVHGDLTTSNFLTDVADATRLTVIDFGLVRESSSAEERAVDLYVLERAVASGHPSLLPDAVNEALYAGYRSALSSAKCSITMERLAVVRARGRKRSMVG